MAELFDESARNRLAFVGTLDDEGAQRIVSVTAGGPTTRFRVTESLLQLCGHGTHHRSQCLNMLRRLDVPPPAIDFVVWLRSC